MNKEDLALNNLQWLICHKTKHVNSCLLTIKTEIHNKRRGQALKFTFGQD